MPDQPLVWPNEASEAQKRYREQQGQGQAGSQANANAGSFPVLPASSIESIEQSEHKQEIFDLLLSGWSPAKISKSLYKQYGEVVPPHDIKGFLDELPPALLLPPSYLRTKLKQIDLTIDAVGELGRVLRLQSERLDTALVLEDVAGRPFPLTDRLSRIYWRMLLDYVDKLQSLGDLPKAPAKFEEVMPNGEKLPRLRDLLEDSDATQEDESEEGEGEESEEDMGVLQVEG